MEPIYEIVFAIGIVLLTGAAVRATLRVGRFAAVRLQHNRAGVTMVEYAILLAVIAIAIVVSAPNITSAVKGVFSNAASVMTKTY